MATSLVNLLKQTHIDDHEEILKSADNALKRSKGDLETQHIKVVALLKLDRFEDAVKALEAGGNKLKEKARLEYAYALYKSGKAKQAGEIASQSEGGRGLQHVEAQSRYRSEEFSRAAELYASLSSRPEGDADADLRVNSGAVDAQLEWAGRGDLVHRKKPAREDMEAFETAYNAACASIARGELGQGEVLLRTARKLCEGVEDMTEEDKKSETAPIIVQHVYVLVRQGRFTEAEKLAKEVDGESLPDASSRFIAKINSLAAARKADNPYLTQRLLMLDLETLKPDYPFGFQTAILKENQSALDLQSMKFGGTASTTQAIISKQEAPTLDRYVNGLSVVNAAAHSKNQSGKEALKHILPLLEKRQNDVGLVLTIAQLYVLTGNSSSAITLIEKFTARLEQSGSTALEVRFAPGLVGTLVSLYSSQNRHENARSELSKAASYWRRKSKDRPTGVLHLLKAAGSSLVESEDAKEQDLAREIFQDLHDRDSQDRYAAAGLLAASASDPRAADTSSLQPIDKLTSGIDAAALEDAGIAAPSKAAITTTLKRAAPESKPTKAKKPRASRLPKTYDPSKTPDPERWLPLKDRSSYKPKGKKGKARQAMFSQGAVGGGESESSRPATPGGEVVKGKQAQGGGGGGANKKKKGKGGKW